MNQLSYRPLVLKTRRLFRYSSLENSQRILDTTATTITLTSTTCGGIFDFGDYRSRKKI